MTGVIATWMFQRWPKSAGLTGMYCPWTWNFTGRIPSFCTFDTLRPIGKVTLFPSLAYQLNQHVR